MKIIIVGTAHPFRGAMAQLNAILAHLLSARHTVQIVSFTRQYPALLFPGTTQLDPSPPVYDVPTVRLIDSINPLSWFRAARHIRRESPDVVVFRYWIPFFAPCFGVIARLTKRWTSARIVYICDNIIPHEHRLGDRALTKFAFRPVDSFVVLSRSVEADLRQVAPEAKYVCTPLPLYDIYGPPLPKQVAREKLGITESRVALFFGFVRPYKGLRTLLRAMPEVRKRFPLRLLIVGEFYENEESYLREIREAQLEQDVTVKSEYVPNADVAAYFSACDVVVLPYESATQSAIVQIAYHFEKPVIATNVGGLPEVVVDGVTGSIVTPGNPQALAEAIVRFYERESEDRFVNGVRAEKSKYTWDVFIAAFENLLTGMGERGQKGN